ncbi:MAG TPA: methionyl-tRNA formyltransferase, partial [Thermoleophilaceae bacterium]|nr:methionyl-tRNA formyltransferase [Thermoleophilaceae bacterium]
PASVNDEEARERIAAVEPEAVAICAYGGLIKEPLLSEHEMLNVHPSLLPRWRGAAPIERAIEAGDTATGVSIMRPTAELDAGPVCLARAEPIRPDDDFGSLSSRLEALAGGLLVEALDARPPFADQPEEGVTFADKVTAEDRRLTADRPAAELERRVRALSPHVGAFVELGGGERLQVLRARVEETESGGWGHEPRAGEPGGRSEGRGPPPGELAVVEGRVLFGCSGGALELLRVKPPGGREMDAAAYVRGHPPPGAPQSARP